jgi:branched-chain amino acid aminotransferase
MTENEAIGPGVSATAWVNGRLVSADEPALTVGDRGFQVGDGVFETLRVRRGVAIELDLHLRRLRDGLAVLGIKLRAADADLGAAIRAVVAANAPTDAAVRLTVSRGAPMSRGILPTGWRDLAPTIVVQAWPYVPVPEAVLARGVRAIIGTGRRDPTHPLATVKTVSRADHVHAKLEAELAGADDAITLTLDGHVAEATTANIAIVVGERVITPPLAAGILAGTTRDWLLRPEGGPALGLGAEEAWFTADDLLAADEAMLCSSVAGFQPLVALDGTPIAGGVPGPWAARLRAAREAWILEQAGG